MLTSPAVSLLLVVWVPSLGAQTPLDSGRYVRVSVAPGNVRHAGPVLRWSFDTLMISPIGSTSPYAVPLSQITRIDVRDPRSRGMGAARGALAGWLTGFVAGILVGANSGGGDTPDLLMRYVPLLGSGIGAAAGSIIGAAKPGHDWWRVQ